jgi:hypothetical protein
MTISLSQTSNNADKKDHKSDDKKINNANHS